MGIPTNRTLLLIINKQSKKWGPGYLESRRWALVLILSPWVDPWINLGLKPD